MSKNIYCVFLRKQAEGQDFQSYPGELGKHIFNNISKEAWAKWQQKQTMLINENKLNLISNTDRNFLEKEMIKFLFKS
ncbi:oxidative damage protection protein [Candidatus Palibaumannia cicadellinicola]|uniref:Probable Fe(2+)-trafficking protein n=1 Tax=Baumannia cicadellinicola subsp. Homalodisca coagulata TaxID=374463 RepID=FETP_BAUCH|nr:oxidative damage protection protein [Candidatus Baumannia cicadellinicola]Q1LSZ8.1 RecName: Full=Probable Fe(2+)-trafficking protein [Baumannia cicadellinicola str. Hc (Homalodisca coagulata)]ABF13782.1 conserved hypothetical protein [Baumannia cicadellinicola str. Hc (Homalodisca coagulata)]MBS0032767.1 oxidative damage protection protein [Candidatus Baumannia cicadellinicola]MCJ7462046.1 oxidative damage protection protein [Candidatus Baumannia cicadellinicola]MCJ7463073.1 oxidative damag